MAMSIGIDLDNDGYRVAAVQLSSQQDVQDNLHRARLWVLRAAAQGAKVVVLPENVVFMGSDRHRGKVARPLGAGNPVFEALSAMAKDAGVWIVAGGVPEPSDDAERAYNTCAVFDRAGCLRYKYRKIHLYDVDLTDGTTLRESRWSTAGREVVCVDMDGLRVGLSICYDLRFPELYRKLTRMGAEVLLVCAAFTATTGKDHWHVLLQARAIENQCYVVAAGQWGQHGKRSTFGRSLIVDPWGLIVAQCSDGEGMCLHDISKTYLATVRGALPALRHRRLG